MTVAFFKADFQGAGTVRILRLNQRRWDASVNEPGEGPYTSLGEYASKREAMAALQDWAERQNENMWHLPGVAP